MPDINKITIASQLLALLGLYVTLALGLLPALLAGLLIFHLVQAGVPALKSLGVRHSISKIVIPALLATLIGLAIAFGIVHLVTFATSASDSPAMLLQKMAEVIETARIHTPAWALQYLPADMDELKLAASRWLREHAGQFQAMGGHVGVFLFRTLMGMIIGGLVAFEVGNVGKLRQPLAGALVARASMLGTAFRAVVFSQIRISALNTTLTALYLLIILPVFGVHLPLTKTMIAVTFLVGLLPILGNLISNTVIVIVSLSVSPFVAAGSLAFLVLIHKLEYFVNAHIIGTQIRARAWELLAAMLVMEAAFGISGLIAAPIYYAYLKGELSAQRLI